MEESQHPIFAGEKDRHGLDASCLRSSSRVDIPKVHPIGPSATQGSLPDSTVTREVATLPLGKMSWAEVMELSEQEPLGNQPSRTNETDPDDDDNNSKGRSRSVRIVIPDYDIDQVIEMVKTKLASINEITQVDTTSKNQITITFKSTVIRDHFMKQQMSYKGQQVYCSLLDSERKLVILRDVPGELDDKDIIQVINTYGKVQSFQSSTLKNYPTIRTTSRRILMTMMKKIPNYLKIKGFKIKVLYEGVVKVCKHCNLPDHSVLNCPTVRCFQCKQLGHIRRMCGEQKKKQIENNKEETKQPIEEEGKESIEHTSREDIRKKRKTQESRETEETEREPEIEKEEKKKIDEKEETEGGDNEKEEVEEEDSQNSEMDTVIVEENKEKQQHRKAKQSRRGKKRLEQSCAQCYQSGHKQPECKFVFHYDDKIVKFRVKPELLTQYNDTDRKEEEKRILLDYKRFIMPHLRKKNDEYKLILQKREEEEFWFGYYKTN